jgi:hypothetical protein
MAAAPFLWPQPLVQRKAHTPPLARLRGERDLGLFLRVTELPIHVPSIARGVDSSQLAHPVAMCFFVV